MATLVLYPDIVRLLRDLIEEMERGDYAEGQLTFNDTRGLPIDIVIRSEEAGHE